jgi:hypothetical protein
MDKQETKQEAGPVVRLGQADIGDDDLDPIAVMGRSARVLYRAEFCLRRWAQSQSHSCRWHGVGLG